MPEQFYIIDGHSMIYRAYYAPFQRLSGGVCPDCKGSGEKWVDDAADPAGAIAEVLNGPPTCPCCDGDGREPTKATYLFTKQLLTLLRERKPSYIAMVSDGPRSKLKRRRIYPQYKQGRGGVGRDVIVQVERIKQIVKAMGIPVFEEEGYEADDVIATLARKCVSDDVHVVVISRDQDLYQLLDDPRITMFDPMSNELMTGDKVKEKKGYGPEYMIMEKALGGCPSDNVKGVPGCGEKAVQQIIAQSDPRGEPQFIDRVIKKCGGLEAALRQYRFNLDLVTLDTNVPVKASPSTLAFDGINWDKVRPIFRYLGFKRWE